MPPQSVSKCLLCSRDSQGKGEHLPTFYEAGRDGEGRGKGRNGSQVQGEEGTRQDEPAPCVKRGGGPSLCAGPGQVQRR